MRKLGSQDSHRSESHDHPAVNGVKKELSSSHSPGLGTVQLNGDTARSAEFRQSQSAAMSAMLPPAGSMPRLASGSPRPQASGATAHPLTNTSSTLLDARWRQPGKGKKPMNSSR